MDLLRKLRLLAHPMHLHRAVGHDVLLDVRDRAVRLVEVLVWRLHLVLCGVAAVGSLWRKYFIRMRVRRNGSTLRQRIFIHRHLSLNYQYQKQKSLLL